MQVFQVLSRSYVGGLKGLVSEGPNSPQGYKCEPTTVAN